MELYIYQNHEIKNIIDSFSSLRWRRKYFESGDFELHVYPLVENIELLAPGNIIRRPDRQESGVIEGVDITDTDLCVYGRMLSSVLSRAIIAKTLNINSSTEQAMITIANEAKRIIPELSTAQAKNLEGSIDIQMSYKNILSAETAVAKSSGYGFRIKYVPPDFIFEVYAGTDHSVAQTENAHVIFSSEFGNLNALSYIYNDEKYRNFAYVAGEGEGTNRTIITVDKTNGKPRREIFVDARDLRRDELSSSEYMEKLKTRGEEKLTDKIISESMEASVINHPNFEYIKNWDLGDIVTTENRKWNVIANNRITEIEEIHENGHIEVIPTLGTPLPEKLNVDDID